MQVKFTASRGRCNLFTEPWDNFFLKMICNKHTYTWKCVSYTAIVLYILIFYTLGGHKYKSKRKLIAVKNEFLLNL